MIRIPVICVRLLYPAPFPMSTGPAALTHARAQLSLGSMDQTRKTFTHKHSKRLTQMVACGG